MAKGNLLLGTAKNSVGDVVMYRREGAQITRVRVRNVKNPKTDAQSFQRAIMAPIAKFYSPLSVVLERSFEGLSKAKSHNKFNQVNANLARTNKWALPKGTGFFPLPYQLSQGTLPALSYSASGGSRGLNVVGLGLTETPSTVGDLSTGFINAGLKDGDIITIILVVSSNQDKAENCFPVTAQFKVDTTSTDVLTEVMPNITFRYESGSFTVSSNKGSFYGGAIIAARFDGNMWRRSTQSLVVFAATMAEVTSPEAVAAAIASYGMSAGDGNPLVYLDGDELADGE